MANIPHCGSKRASQTRQSTKAGTRQGSDGGPPNGAGEAPAVPFLHLVQVEPLRSPVPFAGIAEFMMTLLARCSR